MGSDINSIDQTLQERGKRYGEFAGHAVISQSLKDVMRETEGWKRLNASQKEALEMVQHKVARVLNGDPDYPDNFHDIAGYSKLVEDELLKKEADGNETQIDTRAFGFGTSNGNRGVS